MSGHSLKLDFYMFEISQLKHNKFGLSLLLLEYFPLIAKFTCSKLDANQKYFCMLSLNLPQKWIVLLFLKNSYFLPNVHHSF